MNRKFSLFLTISIAMLLAAPTIMAADPGDPVPPDMTPMSNGPSHTPAELESISELTSLELESPLYVWTEWSPDSTYLAVSNSMTTGGDQLMVYTLNRGDLALVTSLGTYINRTGTFAWSPSGNHIAVGGEWGGDNLKVFSFDGTTLRLVDGELIRSTVSSISWTPDGKHLAVCGNLEIDVHVLSFDGTALALVDSHDIFTGISDRFYGSQVSWDPSGSVLALSGSFLVDPYVTEGYVYIFAFIDRTLIGPTTYEFGESATDVDWSPNGDLLLVGGYNQATDLVVYRTAGGLKHRYGIELGDSWNRASWSPTGGHIMVGSTSLTTNFVGLYPFDGRMIGTGTIFPYDDDIDEVAWSPNGHHVAVAGERGTDHITVYEIKYGKLSSPDEVGGDEDTDVTIDVLANDWTTSGDMKVTSVGPPANGTVEISADGRTVVYTPRSDWHGTDFFTYRHSDMMASPSATVTVTIAPINDAPEITTSDLDMATEDEEYEFTFEAIDVDGDTSLAWSFISNVNWLSTDGATGEIKGVPGNEDVWTYWVNVTVTDLNSASSWRNFTLDVETVNDPPVWLETPGDQNLMGGDPIFLEVMAEDEDGPTLTYGLTSTPTSGIAITPATGTIRWLDSVPGTYTLEITATDGMETIVHSLTVTVEEVEGPGEPPDNELPVVQEVPAVNVTAGEAFTLSLTGSDEDPWDAQNLTFTLTSGPVGMVVSAEGTILWLPTNSQVGTHPVVVELSDSKNATTASFEVEVLEAKVVDDGKGKGDDTGDSYLGLVIALAVIVVILAVLMLLMYMRQR